MASISKKDLEHLSDDEIRTFLKEVYVSSTFPESPNVIKTFIFGDGAAIHNKIQRIERLERLLKQIVVERFINAPAFTSKDMEKAYQAGEQHRYSYNCTADGIEKICECRKHNECIHRLYPTIEEWLKAYTS